MFIRSGSISKSLFALAPALLLVTANNAQAHVKWFCAYSVAGQPDGLANVLCQDFELLSVIAIAALLWGVIVDRCFIGQALNRSLDRVVGLAGFRPDIMVRAGIGLLMVSLWTLGGIILTPELTTTSPYLPWLQLAIAASLIDKRTLVFAAVGIVTLFGVAVADYGVFHMADYPIFLGIAIYFAAIGLDRTIFGVRPLDVLRWSLAITLMWASIEKWAYPEWTYPLFVAHPDMAMGFSPAYYMKAAGVVEFAMAFGLTLSPFARRCSAIMLAATFITAIVGFGKIDAIGHAGVIGVLFAVIHDDAKERASIRQIVTLPLNFGCALATFIGLYYVGHAALYGTSVL
jgi:hypothetical protein